MDDKTRYFVVTTGRTGSTFLAATLAAGGADFGMSVPDDWDPNTGDLELDDVRKAGALLAEANRMCPTVPGNFLTLAIWRIYQKRGWEAVRRALNQAKYIKGSVLTVQPAVYLGFQPRVILNYRRLETQIASQLVRSKYETADYLTANYIQVLRNGLAAVRIFGGCVVAYEDMQDPAENGWIDALAGVTGLDAAAMTAFRDRSLRANEVDPRMPTLSVEAARLWEEAEAMRGQVFPPLRQAERAVRKRTEWLETEPQPAKAH